MSTPPDDPEDRIRGLEPRAGQAGQPDGAGPTPGADRRWVSNLLFGLGLLIIVGGTAGYLLFGREPAPPNPTPTQTPSGGRVVSTPTGLPPTSGDRQGSTRPVIPAPPTIGTAERTAPPGAPIRVNGIDVHKTVACDGNTVEVSGISNIIVVTGHCTQLRVSGIENVVTVGSVDFIEVSGIRNHVTFHSGSPRVDASGDNTAEQG